MALKDDEQTQQDQPFIPFDVLDAPSQRLLALGIYTGLFFWRLYDFYNLTVDETESLWLFMKWVVIDGAFLFGLPGFKIPWLEWSTTTMTVILLLHSLLDGILMFRIPIPLGAALVAMTRILYDREVSVSERRVKPADILHNSSLILGRQIIHILPEGTARLNPSDKPLCINSAKVSADLALQINQTNPILVELLRFDLNTGENETISIPASQIKKMRKNAEKASSHNPSDPLIMKYSVHKTGMYRLQRVLDETNLEVQRYSPDILIVACPKAFVKSENADRCIGDLSDLSLVVDGTPPLQVQYRRLFKNKPSDILFQGIQPEDYASPLAISSSLMSLSSNDVSWAKSHQVSVPLNETLLQSGLYSYSILRVTDALNNIVEYKDDDAKVNNAGTDILVHERPRALLLRERTQLRQGKGGFTNLPVIYSSSSETALLKTVHTLTYLFSRQEDLLANGEHGPNPELIEFTAKTTSQTPRIQAAGLYSLHSISTPFCQGEIEEPSSCLLINPPQPSLSVASDPMSDKCAGNPIGLRLGIDFVGTPPFVVKYFYSRENQEKSAFIEQVFDGLRGELEFKPEAPGHYILTLTEIKDDVYRFYSSLGQRHVFEQEVKPSAHANFFNLDPLKRACIGDNPEFDVQFRGEGPWKLEYEVVHDGRREKAVINQVVEATQKIKLNKLTEGGEYSVVLTAVTDKAGCKENLQQEATVQVRRQLAKAAFGSVEGGREIRMIQGKSMDLPLRLSGEAPWKVVYQIPGSNENTMKYFLNSNSQISVSKAGTYEILSVDDAQCAGSVDKTSNSFEVSFIDRPQISLPTYLGTDFKGGKHILREVCEGEEDAFDIAFRGKSPYSIKCRENATPLSGKPYTGNKDLVNIPQQNAQIKLDTNRAGTYEYLFSEVTDANYDANSKDFVLVVEQKVNPRPTAQFTSPGRVYSFCEGEDSNDQVIPITLTGAPPFTLDIEIKLDKRASKAEPVSIDSIKSHQYDLRIPHRYMLPGTSVVSIRKVRDALGCDRFPDPLSSSRVQISVNQPPSISDLEELKTDYCVGERINYALSGRAPYTVFYTFDNKDRKAQISGTAFRRIAETPGNFTVTGVMDGASSCKFAAQLTKIIHEMPSVRVSQGKEKRVDLHAGSETDIVFDFGGTPPFEFTYIRSENAKHGKIGRLLETKTLVTSEKTLKIKAGEEGTYEVVAIKDRFCAYVREDYRAGTMYSGQKLLQN